MNFQIEPIAYVKESRDSGADDNWGKCESIIELAERFGADCFKGLDTFSHIEVLFVFHKVDPGNICVEARHPRNNESWTLTGIFAQRGKKRPNRIGSTICELKYVSGKKLVVSELACFIHEGAEIDIDQRFGWQNYQPQ